MAERSEFVSSIVSGFAFAAGAALFAWFFGDRIERWLERKREASEALEEAAEATGEG